MDVVNDVCIVVEIGLVEVVTCTGIIVEGGGDGLTVVLTVIRGLFKETAVLFFSFL